MEKYVYSPSMNAFYPLSLQSHYEQFEAWPGDGNEVDEAVFVKYSGVPPEGKMRGSSTDGRPAWVDIPPASKEEQIAVAERQKATLLAEATAVIAPLADAQAGGYIDDADVPRLAEWQRYRYKLSKVNTSIAPDITLPPRPDGI